MRNAAAAQQVAAEQAEATTTTTPKAPRSYSVTLKAADGTTLRLTALRRRIGGQSYAVTSTPKGPDGKRVNERGMTQPHPSFDAAKVAVERLAVEAGKLGWGRSERRAGYTAKPDSFVSLPTPPKPAVAPVKTSKKK